MLERKNQSIFRINYLVLLFCLLQFDCKEKTDNIITPVYKSIEPQYSHTEIHATGDTLHFSLDENMYNEIESFNVFLQNNKEFICFYDQRSQTVSIYDFALQKPVKQIHLKNCLKGQRFYKTSVYCKNFDSVFVTNQTTLYQLDGTGTIKNSIDFLDEPRFAWAVFENITPPILKNNCLYAGVRPYVKETSFKALQKWKILYEFDLQKNTATLYYHFPDYLQRNLFGHRFLESSYCYNDRGNFVFSFGADSTIYETNLNDYHIAYLAKSQSQLSMIHPVSKQDLDKDEGYKNYLLRDSYGPIYFDSRQKKYLRIAKSKISQTDYDKKNRQKKQSIIILDRHFKIVGESVMDENVSLSSLFFSADGSVYTRVNARDEYALHFVRLSYNEKNNESPQIIINEKTQNK